MEKKRNRLAGKGKNKTSKSNESTGRNYDYDKKYQSSPKQKKNRAMRNAARASAIKKGTARVGDNTDVDHIKSIKKGGTNAKGNTKVISRSANRAKK